MGEGGQGAGLRVAVAGGTGLVGRLLTEALHQAGHRTTVLTRGTGVDLVRGAPADALARALDGVSVVVDVTNVTTLRRKASVDFFTAVTTRLLAAEAEAGVRHHVVLSIAGVDRVDLGYYQGKRRQAELALSGPVPATVLPATQFHEFAAQVLARTRGPLVLVPRMRIQPVAAREVAAALASVATGPALGYAPELGGPEERDLATMVRALVHHQRRRRAVVGLRFPGATGRRMAEGALLPQGDGPRGAETFDEWLSRQGPATR